MTGFYKLNVAKYDELWQQIMVLRPVPRHIFNLPRLFQFFTWVEMCWTRQSEAWRKRLEHGYLHRAKAGDRMCRAFQHSDRGQVNTMLSSCLGFSTPLVHVILEQPPSLLHSRSNLWMEGWVKNPKKAADVICTGPLIPLVRVIFATSRVVRLGPFIPLSPMRDGRQMELYCLYAWNGQPVLDCSVH